LRFAQYQQYLESTVKELENNLVISFSELIECRDENTGGHVQRTSKYVETLGTELLKKESFREELTEENLELIVRAAPLHDIGKIGISDTVLLKPGKLTESEYNLMKTHTTIGEEILANMYKRTPTQQYLRYAKVIAGGHHEKFDGTGYPNGLRGNAIPLCCRIMAVADVYDALVADRVYRKAVSHEAAYRIIVEGKNIDFDSKVVEAFEVCHEHLV
jgi:putative two-component system response regulator